MNCSRILSILTIVIFIVTTTESSLSCQKYNFTSLCGSCNVRIASLVENARPTHRTANLFSKKNVKLELEGNRHSALKDYHYWTAQLFKINLVHASSVRNAQPSHHVQNPFIEENKLQLEGDRHSALKEDYHLRTELFEIYSIHELEMNPFKEMSAESSDRESDNSFQNDSNANSEIEEHHADSADDKGKHLQGRSQKKSEKRKKKNYDHKFQSVWEKMPSFQKWIQRSKRGVEFFYCDFCKNDYKAGKTKVERHLKSKKHARNAEVHGHKQISLLDANYSVKVNLEEKCKRNEIKIANFIAEHNLAFNISGDLTKLFQSMRLDSEVMNKMSCGRTKCRAIIVNVSGRYSFECLVDRLRENKFSMMIDELTDKSSVKSLAIVTRMFNGDSVQDEFLCSKEIAKGDTENIYNFIVNYFEENKIPYKTNCIGFAADGASVMMGKNHSVSVKLKLDVPSLFILKCICHSFALVASNASKKLPDDVELLIRLVYSYMHHSFKRLCEFEEFQTFLNLKPHKLLHPCQTRWLSLLLAVLRVREQYPALKLYFDGEHLNQKNQDQSTATRIHLLLSNPINKLYIDFLCHVLPMFTDLNKEFQSETSKIHVIYWKISQVYRTILDCYIKRDIMNTQGVDQIQYKNPHNFVKLEDLYLGPGVAISLRQMESLESNELEQFRLKCLDFYVEAAHEIYLRFPFNSPYQKLLAQMNIVDPAYFKANRPPSVAPLASLFSPELLDVEVLDREWRLLRNDSYVDRQDSNDYFVFWNGIGKILNGDGSSKYRSVFELTKLIATLPHSSAAVEKFFSQINLNKTKLRNSLETDSINGILYTKRLFKNAPSYEYDIPKKMVQKLKNNIYQD